MTMLDFPGRAHLIESIDAAVALGDHAAVAQALRSSLCRMMRENTVALPACVLDPVEVTGLRAVEADRATTSVSVLTEEDLTVRLSPNPADQLRAVPGAARQKAHPPRRARGHGRRVPARAPRERGGAGRRG